MSGLKVKSFVLQPEPGAQRVQLPEGALLLSVYRDEASREPRLAAACDQKSVVVERTICGFTDESEVAQSALDKYLGTVQIISGDRALHFFDGGELP